MIAKHGSARGNRSIADGYADVDDVLVVSAENVTRKVSFYSGRVSRRLTSCCGVKQGMSV